MNLRSQTIVGTLLMLAMLALAACVQPVQPGALGDEADSGAPVGEEKTLYVGPELMPCTGVGPMECMMVKENPDDDYLFFYNNIEGFDFEPGFEYELRVQVDPVANPPADGSSLQYTLIEVVSKTPAADSAGDDAQGGDASAAPAPTLEGVVWEATMYVDADGTEVTPIAGAQPTARLEDGQVGGATGCNNFFGSYTLEGDQLTFGQMGSTMMACPEPLMKQQTDYLAALGAVASYTLDGETLTMFDSAGVPIILFMPQQQVALVDTNWRMTFYNNGTGGFQSALAEVEVTALFDAGGQLGGNAGCNGYGAEYTVDGNTMTIGPAISTMMFCEQPDGVMEQEQAYLAALEMVATYDIQADTLTLFAADGARAVEFIAVAGSADEATSAPSADDSEPASRLGNMTLPNDFGSDGEVQLQDGVFISPSNSDGAQFTVALTDFTATGELDGETLTAAILVADGGGSGTFYDLVAVQGPLDSPSAVGSAILGDRVEIKSLNIVDGEIAVDMVTQGPNDPMCCPTQAVVRTYALIDGELTLVSEEGAEAAMTDETATNAAAEPGAPTLEGVTWQATSYVAADGTTVEALPDAAPTLLFDGGQVSGSTGCNRFRGGFTSDGSGLNFDPLAMTMMACMGPVAEQEAGFVNAFDQVAAYQIDGAGNLELLNADGATVATFVPQVTPTLTGGVWNGIGYNNGRGAVTSLLADTEITAAFSEDGVLSGNASCNQYTADFTVDASGDDNAMTIGPAATTRKLCPPPIMEQEQAYLAALERAAVYAIDGDQLQIRDADGALLADYRLAEDMESTATESETTETETTESEAAEAGIAPATADSPVAATVLPAVSTAITLETGALADSYHWRIAPAMAYDATVPDPVGLPEHVVITFDNQTPDEALRENGPMLYILPVTEYAARWEEAGNSTISANVAELKALLATQSATPTPPLPLLPPQPAVNNLAVQIDYLDGDAFSGLRYVSRLVQDAGPAVNGQFNYNFQGLTNDGNFYIALRWPVTTPALPASFDAIPQAVQDAVSQDFEGYEATTAAMLNALTTREWRPDLSELDALISSLTIAAP